MNKEVVMEKLQEIFRDVFGDKNLMIQESTNAENMEGWDSLAQITILEAVQDEFDIKFSLDEMIDLNSVGKIADSIIGGGV